MGNQNSSRGMHHHPPVNWTQSFPRENKRLKKYGATADTKVLPQRIPGQRLRPTENGHILQTQGTISARRMAEFSAPHHPAFPPPLPLHHQHHPLQQPHSASMTALHYSHLPDERANSMHDLRFGRPPSKNYASEPDLRGPSPQTTVVTTPPPHTIISQSPTKGRIKSKKKYKAPPVPVGGMGESHSLPHPAERSHSVGDVAAQSSQGRWHTPWGVHFAGQTHNEITSSSEVQKPKTRKIGLFRKKNESRRPSTGDEQRSSSDEPERGRATSEDRRAATSSPLSSPRDELRERARSLDCLQHELRQPPVSPPIHVAATSLTELHQPQEHRMWATLERDCRRSTPQEVDSRRSSTIERESRRSNRESKKNSTLERDPQKSHRRMSTLERKVEERKQWVGEGRANSTPSSNKHVSRLDSYRENTSHRRSSSSSSHHELIPEENERSNDRDKWDKSKVDIIKQSRVGEQKYVSDEWDKAEEQINQRKKISASLKAELLQTVQKLRKSSAEQDTKPSTLTKKNKETEKQSTKNISCPSSCSELTSDLIESQPKTFFFGMEPEVARDHHIGTNTGLHKIKNQEEVAKYKNKEEVTKSKSKEEVHINGQTVEYTRRTLERPEKNRSRHSRRESQRLTEPQPKTAEEPDGCSSTNHTDHRKLSKDVEEFAVAIERHKMNRVDGESRASGSSRREDGGYHSRQNSGSLYLDNEHDQRDEGQLFINLRPTLPRRQLEIPRFSPNAAWRSLSLERASKHKETLDETRSSEEPDLVYEARIQRFTRPTAPPRGSGEKSADSGISGDAGSPGPIHEFEPLMPTEKTKSSSGPLAVSSPVASGRPDVRRAWTPAQDLDDNSLDSNVEQTDIPVGPSTPPKLTSRSNMFAKSQKMPPEQDTEPDSPNETETISELISPDKKDHWSRHKKRITTGTDIIPHKFNSLRKLKRTVSGAITGLGHKSPVVEDFHDGRAIDEPQTHLQGEDSNWRDNWSMSRSIPNSLNTCEEQETASNLSSSRNIRCRSESRLGVGGGGGEGALQEDSSRPRTPSYLQYGNAGHIMYLPQYNSRRMSRGEVGSEDEADIRHNHLHHSSNPHLSSQDLRHKLRHSVRPITPENERKPPSGDEDPAQPETCYTGQSSRPSTTSCAPPPSSRKAKSKKFSYQSTVRILEKKKLEEKLTREVVEKEKQRLKEIEAMKKVEEEFQKKREREKKKVKQQLKLFQIQQQQQSQQQQQPQQGNSARHAHNNSYSSDDHAPSSYSSEQNEVSSQASSQPPPLPRSPPPQVYPAFTSLPLELPTETSPGLISGLKSWVRGRKESRSSSSSTTLTSAPRQEPDGAPASSPRKVSDDYGSSGPSSPKNSKDHNEQLKQNFRAEIIAASRKRNANNTTIVLEDHKGSLDKHVSLHKSVYRLSEVTTEPQQQHTGHTQHPQNQSRSTSKHHQKRDDSRRSQSPEGRFMTQGLMQELPELHQERREYREYRSSSRHSRHSHSPPARSPNSPPASISPSKSKSNYRRDFCHGNAQVIGPNVVSVKLKRNDESDRYSKHSSDERRSVGSSGGVQRSASVDLLETTSCSSSSTATPRHHHHSSQHLADTSLNHNYGRMNGYSQVDSSPARFAHSILMPFSPVKGYKPVSFSPPPPTKVLPVN